MWSKNNVMREKGKMIRECREGHGNVKSEVDKEVSEETKVTLWELRSKVVKTGSTEAMRVRPVRDR